MPAVRSTGGAWSASLYATPKARRTVAAGSFLSGLAGCVRFVPFLIRSGVLLALLGSLPMTAAQQDTPTPPLQGIAHVALRVRDLAASIAFYRKLGFEQAFAVEEKDPKDDAGTPPQDPGKADASKPPGVAAAVMKINDRQFVELHPASAGQAARFLGLGFGSADLEALAEDYQSRGLTHTILRDDAAGNLRFTLPGPSQPFGAQQIDFVEYRPGSLHTNDLGLHLGADRVAGSLIAVALAMDDPDAARDFYINVLNFKPISGEPMDLHLPGNSGQEVDLVSADLGSHAQFTLNAENLGKAARHLRKQGLAVEKSGASLSVTDPDGNLIVLETR